MTDSDTDEPKPSRRGFLGLATKRKQAKAKQGDDAPSIPMPAILNTPVTRRNLLPPVLGDGENVQEDTDNDTSVEAASYPLEQQLADVIAVLGIKPSQIIDESSPIYQRMMDFIGRPLDRRQVNKGIAASANPVPFSIPTDLGDIADTVTDRGNDWLKAAGVKIAQAMSADFYIETEIEDRLANFFNSIRYALKDAGPPSDRAPILRNREEVVFHVKSGLSGVIQMRMQQLSMMLDAFKGLNHEQIREAMDAIEPYSCTDGILDSSSTGPYLQQFGIADYGDGPSEEWEFAAGSVRQQVRRFLDTALRDDLIAIAQNTYKQTGVVLTQTLPKSVLKAAELEKITPFARIKRAIPPTPEEKAEEDELIYGEYLTVAKVLEDEFFHITKSQDGDGYIIGVWALGDRVNTISTFFNYGMDGAGGADKEMHLLDRLRYVVSKQYPEAVDELQWLHMSKAEEESPDHSYDNDRGPMKVGPYMAAPKDKEVIFSRSGDYAFKVSNLPTDNEDVIALRRELEAFFQSKETKDEEHRKKRTKWDASANRGERTHSFEDADQLKSRKTKRDAVIAKRLEEPDKHPNTVAYVEALGRMVDAKGTQRDRA